MEPTPNNTRYLLELDRNALLEEKYEFDEKYGTLSSVFLTSLEVLALVVYLYIAAVLIYCKKTRTKTNFIVSVWAAINFAVLLGKLSFGFSDMIGNNFVISRDVDALSQMVSATGRSYGTALSIIWVYSRYFGGPKTNKKWDVFKYFFIAMPVVICSFYIGYYFVKNKFVYEVFGPGCDVIHLAVYLVSGLVFVICKIFMLPIQSVSYYALLISMVNLITNCPKSLMTIYSRFVLDIGWEYRFHLYCADLLVNLINYSNAFTVLFIILFYNRDVVIFSDNSKAKLEEQQPEVVKD